MRIIACDYHPSFQQIALVDTETGELQQRRLGHREEAEQFNRALATAGGKARDGWGGLSSAPETIASEPWLVTALLS